MQAETLQNSAPKSFGWKYSRTRRCIM